MSGLRGEPHIEVRWSGSTNAPTPTSGPSGSKSASFASATPSAHPCSMSSSSRRRLGESSKRNVEGGRLTEEPAAHGLLRGCLRPDGHHLPRCPRPKAQTASWCRGTSDKISSRTLKSARNQGYRVEIYIDTESKQSTKQVFDQLVAPERELLQHAMQSGSTGIGSTTIAAAVAPPTWTTSTSNEQTETLDNRRSSGASNGRPCPRSSSTASYAALRQSGQGD